VRWKIHFEIGPPSQASGLRFTCAGNKFYLRVTETHALAWIRKCIIVAFFLDLRAGFLLIHAPFFLFISDLFMLDI
jgi:hypothetical protein